MMGQEHILGPGKLLRRVIEADRLTNMILYGPPGCGKTTLAEVIAKATRRNFVRASGVISNVASIRATCEAARSELGGMGTILFVDEIHRFNKAQQDVLLPYVEDGSVILIGATTHNPSMFVNTPLTSRSLVFELHALAPADVATLLDRALADPERGLGKVKTELAPDACAFLSTVCDGDARHALTALDLAVRSTPPSSDGVVHLTLDKVDTRVRPGRGGVLAREDAHGGGGPEVHRTAPRDIGVRGHRERRPARACGCGWGDAGGRVRRHARGADRACAGHDVPCLRP